MGTEEELAVAWTSKQTLGWKRVWVRGAGGDSTGEGHRAAPFTRAGLSCDKPSAVLEHLRVSYH